RSKLEYNYIKSTSFTKYSTRHSSATFIQFYMFPYKAYKENFNVSKFVYKILFNTIKFKIKSRLPLKNQVITTIQDFHKSKYFQDSFFFESSSSPYPFPRLHLQIIFSPFFKLSSLLFQAHPSSSFVEIILQFLEESQKKKLHKILSASASASMPDSPSLSENLHKISSSSLSLCKTLQISSSFNLHL
ncbi:unnamed protein product, partial [Vicia faba]